LIDLNLIGPLATVRYATTRFPSPGDATWSSWGQPVQ
jgi:hypothetical protein